MEDVVKAFPAGDQSFPWNRGMTLRDYFAAQAVVGVIAQITGAESIEAGCELAARVAYQTADAMMKARGGEPAPL